MRFGLLVLVVSSGCTPLRDLTVGVAIWPFVLGTEVDVGLPIGLRRTEVFVVVVDVPFDYALEEVPVVGATAWVTLAGREPVPLAPLADGVYGSPPETPMGMPYISGEAYSVAVDIDGTLHMAAAPAVAPLPATAAVAGHPANTPLTVTMPPDYADEYDQLLVTVMTTDGAETWSSRPTTSTGWLRFAARTATPAVYTVPASAFPDANASYAVAVLGLSRDRLAAAYSENLSTALNGYTTGSGFAVAVMTAP